MIIVAGCSSNAASKEPAPAKKENKQAEQTTSPQSGSTDAQNQELDRQAADGIYKINLYAEMTELNHQLLNYKSELGSGHDNLVGFRISTAILDTTEKLSKLTPPPPLEEKHKTMISYLLSGHKYLEDAMKDDMDGKQVDWNKSIDECFTDANKAFMIVQEIKDDK